MDCIHSDNYFKPLKFTTEDAYSMQYNHLKITYAFLYKWNDAIDIEKWVKNVIQLRK